MSFLFCSWIGGEGVIWSAEVIWSTEKNTQSFYLEIGWVDREECFEVVKSEVDVDSWLSGAFHGSNSELKGQYQGHSQVRVNIIIIWTSHRGTILLLDFIILDTPIASWNSTVANTGLNAKVQIYLTCGSMTFSRCYHREESDNKFRQ